MTFGKVFGKIKRYTTYICVLAWILVSLVPVLAQTGKDAGSQKTPVNVNAPELENVRNIVSRILIFQDRKVAAVSAARIADLVWDKDEVYARWLFTFSLGNLAVEEKDSDSEIASKNAAYRRVLSLIAKHDKNWAAALVKAFSKEVTEQAHTNIEIAENLLESDPSRAVEFAKQSLQNELTEGLIWFLKNLRRQNETEANRLFLQILARYSRQANADAYRYALLGTYLFTSPAIDPQDYQTIAMTRIGNIIFPNITTNFPNVPANLIREYIRAAVPVILRPTGDATQRQMKYALGYVLLQKAREFAPDLAGELSSSMALLTVPAEFFTEDAFKNLKVQAGISPAERISEIEKLSDAPLRDRLFLDVVYRAWHKNDFETAKIAAAKIEDKDVRGQLDTLILFGEGKNLLKDNQNNLDDVMRIAEKLPVSLEKTLLWIAISTELEKQKLPNNALEAVRTSGALLNDENTAFILLFVSGQMAKNGDLLSEIVLTEAIKSFNKFENLTNPSLFRKVTLEPLSLRFNLAVGGPNLDFQQSFENAAQGKEEMALHIIKTLKDERFRGQAFVILAKLFLAKKPPVVQTNEQVVRVGEDGIRKSAVKTLMPVYPKESLKKKVKGAAVAEIQYNGNGDITEVKILESPDAATAEAVAQTMRQWRFKPSKLGDKPVSIRGKITFYFVINSKGRGTVENPKQFQ